MNIRQSRSARLARERISEDGYKSHSLLASRGLGGSGHRGPWNGDKSSGVAALVVASSRLFTRICARRYADRLAAHRHHPKGGSSRYQLCSSIAYVCPPSHIQYIYDHVQLHLRKCYEPRRAG